MDKNKKERILIASIWEEEKYKYSCNTSKTYDLAKKEDLKRLALDSLNYMVRGYKIELISISHDFIYMISEFEVLYIGYTNRLGEYNQFNISDIVFPSEEYGCNYFDAYCIDKDGEQEGLERTFKIERIEFIKESNLKLENIRDANNNDSSIPTPSIF